MPSSTDVMQAMRESRFDDVKQYVNESPDLVNAFDEKSTFSLLKFGLVRNAPDDLITFITAHPKFDFNYSDKKGVTNIDNLLKTPRKDALLPMLASPQSLFNKDKLTYACAKTSLMENTQLLNAAVHLKDSAASKYQAYVDALEPFLPKVREATIRQAIATDDPKILASLEQAGDDLDVPLASTGLSPMASLSKNCPDCRKWFVARFEEKVAQRPQINLNSFFASREVQKTVDTLTEAHLKGQIKSLDEQMQDREERISTGLKTK